MKNVRLSLFILCLLSGRPGISAELTTLLTTPNNVDLGFSKPIRGARDTNVFGGKVIGISTVESKVTLKVRDASTTAIFYSYLTEDVQAGELRKLADVDITEQLKVLDGRVSAYQQFLYKAEKRNQFVRITIDDKNPRKFTITEEKPPLGMEVDSNLGISVSNVDKKSLAEDMGFRPGDLFLDIHRVSDVYPVLSAKPGYYDFALRTRDGVRKVISGSIESDKGKLRFEPGRK